jgi:ubiquinone/menaquinone biosynthesis C-methylase UbiE
MNRVEALDRYGFTGLHNFRKKEGMPESYRDRVLNEFIGRVKRRRNPIVLDLASGLGKTSTAMDEAGLNTVRLDLSIKSLRLNHGKNVQAMFDGLPFTNKSFSAIHFKDALVHVANRTDLFKRLFQILKPGGELLLVTSERNSMFPIYMIRYKKGGTRIKGFFTEDQYIEDIKKMKKAGRMNNKEVDPPYYPFLRRHVIRDLECAGFQINFLSNWKPRVGERDWYRLPELRHVYSAIKPR